MEEKIDNIAPEEHYELTILTKEEDISAVKKTLEKYGAKIVKEGEVQKIRLAYPIKKHAHAYLWTFLVFVPKDRVEKISGELNLTDQVLRYVLTLFDIRKIEESEKRRNAEKEREKRPLRGNPKKITEPVLTNEALEKKIEEILK